MMDIEPGGPDPRDDLALLEAVRRGDQGAFRSLFRRYHARVWSFVLRRVSDTPLAEELVEDVFFEVWRSADRFRGEARVSSWLFGIAHFTCRRALRDRRAAKRSQVVPMNVEYLYSVPDLVESDQRIESRADLARVLAELESLPESYRTVLHLALEEGLSYEEIGRRLGIDADNVKTRVSRARARLRRQVGRDLGAPR
jgi:RNA polymerase sigma-70 factor (ECF subfamily)